MGKWAAIAALLVPPLLGAWSDPAGPTQVTYGLGGIVSGPYRTSADLAAGTATEALPPSGRLGDGAGVRTGDLPVTSSRPLAAADAEDIGRLARKVLAEGAFHCRPEVPPTADAIGMFEIVAGGEPTRMDGPTPCMTAAASELVERIRCAANPAGRGCGARPR